MIIKKAPGFQGLTLLNPGGAMLLKLIGGDFNACRLAGSLHQQWRSNFIIQQFQRLIHRYNKSLHRCCALT